MGALTDGFRYPARTWVLNLFCWSAGAVLVTSVFYVAYSGRQDFEFVDPLRRMLPLIGSFGLLAPPVFRWGSSWEWTPGAARRRISQAIGIFLAFLALHCALYSFVRVTTGEFQSDPTFLSFFGRSLARLWYLDAAIFTGIVGVAQTAAYRRRLQEKELEAVELRRQLVEAQLAALRAQLQPHFLFNTLHTIGVFTRKDPEAANRILALVGDLLRRSLETVRTQEITLREELEFLKPYLEIQRTRFQDRLAVYVQVEEDVLDCIVPSLVLQPIVENAVRHGVETRAGEGTVHIRGWREGDDLVLEVEDDGVGLPVVVGDGPPIREGMGLGNTRERISRLYGDRGELKIEPAPEQGVLATVRIPLIRRGAEERS